MQQDTTSVLLVHHARSPGAMFLYALSTLQACLGQRYDVNTKSLDLSDMFHDPSEFQSNFYPTHGDSTICMYVCMYVSCTRSEGEWSERFHV